MKIGLLSVGYLGTNCYLVSNEETGRAFIVDPGGSEKLIARVIEENKLVPEAILLTHGHFDHILGVPALLRQYGIPLYAGENEREVLLDPKMNLTGEYRRDLSLTLDRGLADGEEITLAGVKIRVIWTPGHTEGSVCYLLEDGGLQILLSGDTLFQASWGRTDFPTGDQATLFASIREKLFTLPGELRVLPGHGDGTTIGTEKRRWGIAD